MARGRSETTSLYLEHHDGHGHNSLKLANDFPDAARQSRPKSLPMFWQMRSPSYNLCALTRWPRKKDQWWERLSDFARHSRSDYSVPRTIHLYACIRLPYPQSNVVYTSPDGRTCTRVVLQYGHRAHPHCGHPALDIGMLAVEHLH